MCSLKQVVVCSCCAVKHWMVTYQAVSITLTFLKEIQGDKRSPHWVVSSFWSHRSPNFWTNLVADRGEGSPWGSGWPPPPPLIGRSGSATVINLFSLIKLVYRVRASVLLINRWSYWALCIKAHGNKAWVRNCILATCKACSTKASFHSCRVFLEWEL